jgi:hypothetical protein
MGYDLHITRRAEWSDPDSGPPITREEFECVVLGDARFQRDERLGLDYAMLMKKPRGTEHAPWLCWLDGEIVTKSPPRSFIEIVVEIAGTLNARVVGDDGEEYGADGRAAGAGDEEHDEDGAPDGRGDPRLVESDADMRTRVRRERVVLMLQWSGIAAFLAIFATLLGRQLGWW